MTSPILLVSDLDGTLLGDDASLQEFARWHARFQDRIWLVYASGRLPASVRASLDETALPRPIAIVGGVGTEICWLPRFESPPDWPRARHPKWSRPAVLEALDGVDNLLLQDAEFQSPWKVSYHFRGADDGRLRLVESRLAAANLEAELIYSSDRDLDILPRGVNKGSAARFIARRLRIPPRQVIGCGDSGNDAALIGSSGYGIIVGNALPELKTLASDRAYLAQSSHAAGVLEGLNYWLPRLYADESVGLRPRLKRL